MYYRPQLSYIVPEDPASYLTPSIEPVHLWQSTRKDVIPIRKAFFRQWLFASIELWVLIFLISTIYIGSGHNPSQYAINLDVTIIDFDNDLAGYYFFNSFQHTPPGNLTLHWRFRKGIDYQNNIDNPLNELVNGKVWATVVLRPNTTRFINESLAALINTTASLTSPFVVTPTILVRYEEGRNSYTINNYVLLAIRAAIAKASAQYGQVLRQQLLNQLSSSSNSSNIRNSQLLNVFQLGSLLVDPLSARYYNLHPAYPFVGQLATTLGYIYVYLVSALVVGATIRFVTPFVGKIHVVDLIIYRILNGFFQGFIISLIYSLIVLWFFGIDSGRLFMRYWMFNWLASLVFGIIFAIFTTNLGPIGNSALLVFLFLMLAGGTIQISLELSPRFYRYGYGLPFYNIINGGRHLLFGSHSRFALNVGVLLIFLFTFWTVAAVTSTFWMKRQEKKVFKENQKKKTTEKKKTTDKRRYFPPAFA